MATSPNIGDDQQETPVPWSQIVATGSKMKVPNINNRYDATGAKRILEHKVHHECFDLAEQMRIHRAETILQQALQESAVLFELPRAEFKTHMMAYKAIEDTLGCVLGCRNIESRQQRQQYYLIETTFAAEESTEQAITRGITLNGVQYRGTPMYNDKEKIPEMVRVALTGVPFAEEDHLQSAIIESMSIYGKVCQIKMAKNSGFFEGEMSVLFDRQETGKRMEPLQRMLYLTEWNRYIAASFRGAPPICYHCRQSNHLKKDCPILAEIKCYACKGKGHMARNCRIGEESAQPESSFEEDLDGYLTLQAQQQAMEQQPSVEKEQPLEQEQSWEQPDITPYHSEEEDELPLDQSVIMEYPEEPIMDDEITPKDVPEEDMQGPQVSNKEYAQQLDDTRALGASRQVPGNADKIMEVNNAKEMLALTATKTATRKRLPIVRNGDREIAAAEDQIVGVRSSQRKKHDRGTASVRGSAAKLTTYKRHQ